MLLMLPVLPVLLVKLASMPRAPASDIARWRRRFRRQTGNWSRARCRVLCSSEAKNKHQIAKKNRSKNKQQNKQQKLVVQI